MSEKDLKQARCLCGEVEFSGILKTNSATACHCDMCRRWGGGPFLEVTCDHLEFEDTSSISIYDSSPWAERGFCKSCGTHLFYHIKGSDEYQLPVGLFEDAVRPSLDMQVFIDKKPEYYEFSNQTKTMTEAEVIAMYAAKD